MRLHRLFSLVALTAVVWCPSLSPVEGSDKNTLPADMAFEQGKHYRVEIKEVDRDEAITTIYWATVRHANDESVTLADGEWAQHTGPVEKPRAAVLLTRFFSTIDRMLGNKPVVGVARGIPMGDDIVVIRRGEIARASAMSVAEIQMREEAREIVYPRPPHSQ